MTRQLMGTRLRALRTARGLTQADLARLLGFRDRQTVSAIENGVRRMRAEELVLAVEHLDASLEDFTDPFRLTGEERFSWRHTGVGADQLLEYERVAGRWLAAFRMLAPKVGYAMPSMRRSLRLTRRSRFEDAMRAGEHFAAEFRLGSVPATGLARVMEHELGIVVLMVDAARGISGAACRLAELDAVLIARHEIEGRRHFDLAHELFHILTWETMPPAHSEEVREAGGGRVEQLANSFAAALLMPASTLERWGSWRNLSGDALVGRLNAVADELRVSSSALRWRLVALGKLQRGVARSLPEAALANNGHGTRHGPTPALFSRMYLEVLGLAIDEGFVSVRRAANLLDRTVDGLPDVFAAHGIERAVAL